MMEFDIFKGIQPTDANFMQRLVTHYQRVEEQVLASLPFVTSELIGIYGFEEAMRLSVQLSGEKIYMSEKSISKHELSQESDILWTVKKFEDSSGYIEFPASWSIFGQIRQVAISEFARSSNDIKHIQKMTGVSRRSIFNMKA